MGIRQKLYLAVGALAALTLISNLVGGLFFNRVQHTYAGITTTNLPAVVAALNLSSLSAELTAWAPALAAADDDATREKAAAALAQKQERLKQTLELVKASTDAEQAGLIEEIEKTVDFLDSRMKLIDRIVTAKLGFIAQQNEIQHQLGEDFAAFQAQMGPALNRAVQALRQQGTTDDTAAAANALIAANNAVNQAVGVISVAAQATVAPELENFSTQFAQLNAAVLEELSKAAKQFEINELQAVTSKLLSHGTGTQSLFQVRRSTLGRTAIIANTLAQARDAATELASKVEALVAAASAAADETAATAADQTTTAQIAMVAITVLCLGIAAAIAFFFIGPQITAPILRLTAAMRRLAERDWSVDLSDAKRQDEIGAMAAAVEVFKTSGQENERLQQEVEASREAFESERKAQEKLIEDAIGQIVNAATAGDLSRRIDADRLQGVMHTLGVGVNELLATVDKALGDLGAMLNALAHGDLTHRISEGHRGVFARLASDANSLAEKLAEIVGSFAAASATVRDAAAEISGGSRDLAQRTESQTASLQRTAASMEEITATVRHTADNARQANLLASSAREAALRGGAVVENTVNAMGQIEEGARKIVDIVSLIDEIAFQTNLLALNASVEAARAGEAGKGFAVVAQEVRALAQRSADASKDIKTLIAASNAQVRDGAKLVNETGRSLTEIVDAVKSVAAIIEEISIASQEQASGLDEINDAVAQMDEMTQHNSALVEETTASAQALADQARELAASITFFKLDQEPVRSAAE
ncbi:methyl-accepting chemotaxis protein [uncultured Ferrovibrio sp.]|jgi:methyl-accepting chemotaxis protein|uniref:methyl-accepting chemotaxis protein n=1 Tax=uncultured Ferrovibrio sp. TaxID=1576913 RepID=UPI00260CA3A5|nr:methyl-accepting chemotaxis protein [uncultured Ferrovibrio sp.]